MPPIPFTRESFVFGTWRAPHSWRSCRVASMIGKIPYMPLWVYESPPPVVLMGSLPPEAQRLQHERRAGGEGVVEHDVVEVRALDAGHRERLLARPPGGLAEREVAHLRQHDVLAALAGTTHVDRPLGAILRAVRPRQDHGAAGVGDRAE